MRAGNLRQSLYLQAQTSAYGNPGAWSNVATNPLIRCSMTYGGTKETEGRSGERSDTALTIRMRYRSDITTSHRFFDGGSRYFDITGIVNLDERNKELIISVDERANG